MQAVKDRLLRIETKFADPDFEETRERFSSHVDLVGKCWDRLNDAPTPTRRGPCAHHRQQG